MSYTAGKVQRFRIALMRVQHAQFFYDLSKAADAVLQFLSGGRDNYFEPPFGGGGSVAYA